MLKIELEWWYLIATKANHYQLKHNFKEFNHSDIFEYFHIITFRNIKIFRVSQLRYVIVRL